MKKLIIKLLVIVMLFITIYENISYATTITQTDLRKSLEKMFSQNIEISTAITKDGYTEEIDGGTITADPATVTSKMTIDNSNMQIEDKKIICKEDNLEYYNINYELKDNIVTFELDIDMEKIEEYINQEDGNALIVLGILMSIVNDFNVAYLSTADACNIDLETAYDYYLKIINEQEDQYNISTEEFEFKSNLAEDTDQNSEVNAKLIIYLDKFSKLDASKTSSKYRSTIKLLNSSTSGELEDTNTNKNTNKNTSNKANNTNNQINNNNNINKNNVDTTIANKIIPKTGSELFVTGFAILIVFVMIIYIKLRKYKEVK